MKRLMEGMVLLIILLQKYYAGTGHEGKDVYYYFDPIGEIEGLLKKN